MRIIDATSGAAVFRAHAKAPPREATRSVTLAALDDARRGGQRGVTVAGVWLPVGDVARLLDAMDAKGRAS